MVFDYLVQHYESGEPIFLSDICIEGVSTDNLRYHMKRLVDSGVLKRFESGVYYVPEKNKLNEDTEISAQMVAFHKYINRQGKIVGFYSGDTLANRLGLTTQIPMIEEITSNLAPAPVREIMIGDRKYVIRRPVVEITDDNIYILQLLDCLKDIDNLAEENMENCGRILTQYINEYGITKRVLNEYIGLFPVKVYKAIYDTGLQLVY